jgi:hypothetical protein
MAKKADPPLAPQSDNLRGYPLDKTQNIIYIELVRVPKVDCTHSPGVCARITRIPQLKKKVLTTLKEISHFVHEIHSPSVGQQETEQTAEKEEKKNLRRSQINVDTKKKNLDEEELLLVDLLHAPKGTHLLDATANGTTQH